MTARTFTEHRLDDRMLQRLARICEGKSYPVGIVGAALIRRGLAEDIGENFAELVPTDAGRAALEQARQEGWRT